MDAPTAPTADALPERQKPAYLPTPALGYAPAKGKYALKPTTSQTTTPTTPAQDKNEATEPPDGNPIIEALPTPKMEMTVAPVATKPKPVKKKGIHTLATTKADEEAEALLATAPTNTIVSTTINTSLKVVLTEVFDTDVMDALLNDPLMSQKNKKSLTIYNRTRTGIGQHEVVYSLAKRFEEHGLGRLYAKDKQGLQAFPNDIRDPLQAKHYWDLDLENCHYVILADFAEEMGFDVAPLRQYINNRTEELAKVSANRTIAKVAFLKIPYGGSIDLLNEMRGDVGEYKDDAHEGDATLLKAIEKVMGTIVDAVWSKNERLHHLIPKNKHNKKFCLLAHILQTKECDALKEICAFMKTKGRQIDTLIHDGGRVRKLPNEEAFPTALMRECEAHLLKTTKIRHTLAIKPLKPYAFTKPMRQYVELGDNECVDALYATKHLVKLLNGKILVDTTGGGRSVRVFSDTTGMWEEGQHALSTEITNNASKLVFWQKVNGTDKCYNFGGTTKGKADILNRINDIEGIHRLFGTGLDTSKHKLLFKDGIYDSKLRTFTEGYDPKIVFHGRIDRNCPKWLYTKPDDSEECEAFLKVCEDTNKILFIDPFTTKQIEGKVNTFYQVGLARALMGEVESKRFYTGVGDTNSGKGVMTMGLTNGFGTFVGTFTVNNLSPSINNTDDDEKKLGWTVPIRNMRLTISNEANVALRIDGALLSKVVSGGTDPIKARKLHENAIEFIPKNTLLILANDLPTITSAGNQINQRACVVEYEKSFLVSPDPAFPDTQMKIRPELLDYFKVAGNLDSLVYVMVKAYENWIDTGADCMKPKMIEMAYDEWVGAGSSIKGVLTKAYVLTPVAERTEETKTTYSELAYYLKNNGIKDSPVKIGKELEKMGLTKITKKVAGKSSVYYLGISKVSDDE